MDCLSSARFLTHDQPKSTEKVGHHAALSLMTSALITACFDKRTGVRMYLEITSFAAVRWVSEYETDILCRPIHRRLSTLGYAIMCETFCRRPVLSTVLTESSDSQSFSFNWGGCKSIAPVRTDQVHSPSRNLSTKWQGIVKPWICRGSSMKFRFSD